MHRSLRRHRGADGRTRARAPGGSGPRGAALAAAVSPLSGRPPYFVGAAFSFIAFAVGLLWCSRARGLWRWVAAAAALAPGWVVHAVLLGRVVPLGAAAVVLACRLVR